MQAPNFSQYPYRYVRSSQSLGNNGVALFSKYPLIRTGAISLKIQKTVVFTPIFSTNQIRYASTTSILNPYGECQRYVVVLHRIGALVAAFKTHL